MSPKRSPASPSRDMELHTDPGLFLPVNPVLTPHLLRLTNTVTRRKREMTPTLKKDAAYWDKRLKNNEAAKRSRQRRRLKDLLMEGQLLALGEENVHLRAKVLSMQYASATSTAWSLSPYTKALFQAGMRAPFQGVGQNETGSPPFEAMIHGFDCSPHILRGNCATNERIFPLAGPQVLPPRAAGIGAKQRQVSFGDDSPTGVCSHPGSTIRAFVPTPDTLHQASAISYPPPNWLGPRLSNSAVCNNLLRPWGSSCPAPAAVYTGLPLYCLPQTGDTGVEFEAHLSPHGR